MNGRHEAGRVVPMAPAAGPSAGLPYVVELWDLPRTAIERELGRAEGAVLARAIFQAAATEHPGRRVVLRRGEEILAETG